MTRSLILVGIGSCVGGITRYLTQLFVQKHYPSSFPFGTLSINVTGCFLIGIIYAQICVMSISHINSHPVLLLQIYDL
jgi:CrcB protein